MAQSIETVTAYIETVEPKWRIAYQQVLDVVSQNANLCCAAFSISRRLS